MIAVPHRRPPQRNSRGGTSLAANRRTCLSPPPSCRDTAPARRTVRIRRLRLVSPPQGGERGPLLRVRRNHHQHPPNWRRNPTTRGHGWQFRKISSLSIPAWLLLQPTPIRQDPLGDHHHGANRCASIDSQDVGVGQAMPTQPRPTRARQPPLEPRSRIVSPPGRTRPSKAS